MNKRQKTNVGRSFYVVHFNIVNVVVFYTLFPKCDNENIYCLLYNSYLAVNQRRQREREREANKTLMAHILKANNNTFKQKCV